MAKWTSSNFRFRLGGPAMVGILSVAVACIAATSASAQPTHKYLYSFPVSLPGVNGQVTGVDPEGNVYVYTRQDDDAGQIRRYDGETGVPIPFEGLDSYVLDGEG